MNIIIIGASFAGLSAALKAAQLYPQAKIRVVDRQDKLAYIPNSLNWSLRQDQEKWDYSLFKRESLEAAGIQLLLGQECQKVLWENQEILLENGQKLEYDKLILAAGSSQHSTYIEGSQLPGVLMSKDYTKSLHAKDQLQKAQRIAVIGAGQIGIEASETYALMGKEVFLFDANPSLDFKVFDSSFLRPLEEAMSQAGVHIACGQRVQAIQAIGQGLQVQTPEDQVTVDAVMLCAGFRPNTQFLEDLPILASDKTVWVDAYLQTKLPHVFAVGDMIRLPLLDQEDSSYMPQINSALKTGEMAAYNLFEPRYPLPLSVRLVSGHHYGWYRTAIGLTADEAQLFTEISIVDYQAPYCIRDQRALSIRLVVEKDTGRLLGAQALCQRDCTALLQTLVYPMTEQKTDRDLAFQDFLFTAGESELFYHLHKVMVQSLEQRGGLC